VLTANPSIFYLHGFASSARSTKARFIGERLAAAGHVLHAPDFNQPDFHTLTVSRMLGQLEEQILVLPPGPVVLIGSSLGAFVAVVGAAEWARAPWRVERGQDSARADRPITRLVLLAPALDFSLKNDRHIGPERLKTWRDTNQLEIFHYGEGATRTVGYDLYADAQRYDPRELDLAVPALVFQGRRDESVDPAMVREWAERSPTVTLRLVDDDHQLIGSLDLIWRETAAFLGISHA
jgi:pimeloyl-ACP methyl ester carboxylesterase